MDSPAAENSITIAIFQGHAELGEVRSNVENMKKQIKEAKKRGADLVVFPELFTTGYFLSREVMRKLAEKQDGSTFLELSECARETGIGVLYGYPELSASGDNVYNTIQFLDKSGKSLENYRKCHPWIEHATSIETVFTPGDRLSNIFEFCGVKIGLLICYDVEFGETVRSHTVRGADVVLVPTACTNEYDMKFLSTSLVATRAFENGVYVAYVNYCGSRFAGASRCYNPKGEALIACGEEEGLFLTEFKKIEEKQKVFLRKRRPELYGDLSPGK